ncbi:vancomycin high temperature exclusion protein [Leeuwenhoekiella sp. A16]|uniref:SanA/YdcF family protein n=1 Tax=unclassified Leeuwenhoekiella TaxID=2615029 RepID=UPI003A802477
MRSKKIRLFLITMLVLFMGLIVFTLSLSYHIQKISKPYIYDSPSKLPETYTVIVLGASVKRDGKLSTILRDRVESALRLYRLGKVKRFLLSGDNGTAYYNEPMAMKKYLLERGVPETDIFLDFAGFDTYNSVFRASYIFNVDKAIVVSQHFHLPRVIYIARSMNLDYYGFNGDLHNYDLASRNQIREKLASVKAWGELLINREPHFKGEKIPITGKNN